MNTLIFLSMPKEFYFCPYYYDTATVLEMGPTPEHQLWIQSLLNLQFTGRLWLDQAFHLKQSCGTRHGWKDNKVISIRRTQVCQPLFGGRSILQVGILTPTGLAWVFEGADLACGCGSEIVSLE